MFKGVLKSILHKNHSVFRYFVNIAHQKFGVGASLFLNFGKKTRISCFFAAVVWSWYFHFPLQYFSITTFYISQFSPRSRIRSATQQNLHFQKKGTEKYEILCVLPFSKQLKWLSRKRVRTWVHGVLNLKRYCWWPDDSRYQLNGVGFSSAGLTLGAHEVVEVWSITSGRL